MVINDAIFFLQFQHGGGIIEMRVNNRKCQCERQNVISN